MVDRGALLKRLISEGRISDPASPRGRVLAAAARQFRRQGYHRTTVRALASEIGILSGSIFHHFENKDAILFAVMDEVVVAMDEALKAAIAEAPSTRDRVRALISVELQFIHGKTGDACSVLIHEWAALTESRQQKILAGRKRYFQSWRDTLEQARREGLCGLEPEYLMQLIHGAMAWTAHWYRPDGDLSLEGLIDRVMCMALARCSAATS